jgi:sigma-54-specific transcriptional regulator
VTPADLSLSPLIGVPAPEPAAAAPAPAAIFAPLAAPAPEPEPETEPAPVLESERFHAAWQALLDSGEQITFEALQLQLVLAAWESSERNQLRTARYLNIPRNVLRTYLIKAGVLA